MLERRRSLLEQSKESFSISLYGYEEMSTDTIEINASADTDHEFFLYYNHQLVTDEWSIADTDLTNASVVYDSYYNCYKVVAAVPDNRGERVTSHYYLSVSYNGELITAWIDHLPDLTLSYHPAMCDVTAVRSIDSSNVVLSTSQGALYNQGIARNWSNLTIKDLKINIDYTYNILNCWQSGYINTYGSGSRTNSQITIPTNSNTGYLLACRLVDGHYELYAPYKPMASRAANSLEYIGVVLSPNMNDTGYTSLNDSQADALRSDSSTPKTWYINITGAYGEYNFSSRGYLTSVVNGGTYFPNVTFSGHTIGEITVTPYGSTFKAEISFYTS